jgi:WD40 repeat protein
MGCGASVPELPLPSLAPDDDVTCAVLEKTLDGISDYIWALATSPDGETIYTGDRNGSIGVWKNDALVDQLRGHLDAVKALVIAKDGKTLYSGSTDHTIRVWELPSGKCKNTFTGHSGEVTALALSPDGETLFSTAAPGDIIHESCYDRSESKKLREWIDDPVFKRFVVGTWSLRRGELCGFPISQKDFGEEHSYLSRTRFDTQVAIAKLTKLEEEVQTYKLFVTELRDSITKKDWAECERFYEIWRVAYSLPPRLENCTREEWLENTIIPKLISKFTRSIETSEAEINKPVKIDYHYRLMQSLAVTPDGKTLYTGTHDPLSIWPYKPELKSFALPHNRMPRSFAPDLNLQGKQKRGILSMIVSPDGKYLYSGACGGTIAVYSLPGEGLLHKTNLGKKFIIEDMVLSHDGNTLYVVGGVRRDFKVPLCKVHVFSTGKAELKAVARLERPDANMTALALSPDSKTLYSTGLRGLSIYGRKPIMMKWTTRRRASHHDGGGGGASGGGACINQPGKWDYFISHVQTESAAIAEALYGALVRAGHSVWFDVKMKKKDDEAMIEGVKNSAKFVPIVSSTYFERKFCILEASTARECGAKMVPCVDREDKTNIGALLSNCPPQLKDIGNIEFISLDRSDHESFDLGVRKVEKSPGRALLMQYSLPREEGSVET